MALNMALNIALSIALSIALNIALNIALSYITLSIALNIVDSLRLRLRLSRRLASYYRGYIVLILDILIAFSYLAISSSISNNTPVVSPYRGLINTSIIVIFFSLII